MSFVAADKIDVRVCNRWISNSRAFL